MKTPGAISKAPDPDAAGEFLSSLRIAALTLDAHARVEWANPAAARYFKMPAAELLGRPFRRLIESTNLNDAMEEAACMSDWARFCGRVHAVAGSPRYDGSIRKLRGPAEGWSVTLSECAEQRRAFRLLRSDIAAAQRAAARESALSRELEMTRDAMEAIVVELSDTAGALKASREAALRTTETKSRFLAAMSHEIRTPMNGVMGMLEIVLRDELPEEVRERIETARCASADLIHVLNDILDLARLENGRMTLEEAPYSPLELAGGVAALFRTAAERKGVTISCAWSEEPPEFLLGDAARLRQILLNLVGNAVKFTECGSIAIDLSYSSDYHALMFAVTDTGVGISEAQADSLFDCYKQADPSTARRFGGAGLGLAICKELVELMDGRIGADGEPGVGSKFWFEIPTPVATGRERSASVASRAPTLGSGSQAPLRVLVAEDNVVNQKVVTAYLADEGHMFDVVDDGQKALDAVLSSDYDVVLMDIRMPKLDGVAATRAIRELPGSAAETPIIALTANVLQEDREHFLTSGMNGFLAKPLRPEELAAALSKYARRRSSAAA